MSVLKSVLSPVLGVAVISGRGLKSTLASTPAKLKYHVPRAARFMARGAAVVAGGVVGITVAPLIEVVIGATVGMRLAEITVDHFLPVGE